MTGTTHKPSPIKGFKEALDDSFNKLKKYQKGEIKVIKTKRKWLDEALGGLIPGDIVTIGGGSSMGKSHEALSLRNDIMDINLNPDADKYVWLSNAYEMRTLSLVVRDLNKKLGKSKKEIYNSEFTKEESEIANQYYKEHVDGRFFINEEVLDAQGFYVFMSEFLKNHTDKHAVFIDIDHIALTIDDSSNTQTAVGDVTEAMNTLKKEYPNVIFIILSQLNREMYKRISEKNIESMLNSGDLYYSSTIMNISDYVYFVHNPYKIGIDEFGRFSAKAYPHLQEFFTSERKGKISLKTLGNIFYIIIKARENDTLFTDIYMKKLNLKDVDKWSPEEEDDIMNDISVQF